MSEMRNNIGIPRPPDVVTILWQRNPLRPRAPRTIVEATIIGDAGRCDRFLRTGQLLRRATDCLLESGFERIAEERLGVFGVSVFVRED